MEDFTFGEMMKEAKTGKTVTRETIMEKLKLSFNLTSRLKIKGFT
jgi:hypothetical protein